ncbi:MAG: AraC family transcriptional regulator [Oscillospiraceae bacterium]|nr:AraC family transcriptional regulator [Oscillospiraceae bacterium]
MYYEAELRMLRDTFRKCRIQTSIADLNKSPAEHPDMELHAFLADKIDHSRKLSEYIPDIKPATIYRLRDPFGCRYLYLPLPELPTDAILVIGPYLPETPTQQQIMEWSENKGISPVQQKQLKSYYEALPILPETSHLFVLLDAFAERLWGANEYTVEDIAQESHSALSLLTEKNASSDEEDTLWNMKNIEQRYAYENELMTAVSRGQLHKADMLLTNSSSFFFEQRVADPVRNAKNYCIIMNTLLRKSAEKGGVHPMYLDSTSSSFAVKIEQVHSLEAILPLMTEMFRSYCRLVRKHSLKDYSPPVQKALTYIDANLAGSLSLRTLAETLNVSSSYLSTLFKKETGQTITEYINQRRVKHAKHLLESTRLQVQTIAQHCGIVDVQYFSRVFKRIAGMTPKEYRESLKR